jgi:hypothetical protein
MLVLEFPPRAAVFILMFHEVISAVIGNFDEIIEHIVGTDVDGSFVIVRNEIALPISFIVIYAPKLLSYPTDRKKLFGDIGRALAETIGDLNVMETGHLGLSFIDIYNTNISASPFECAPLRLAGRTFDRKIVAQ